jgi:hypothetical protein
MRQAVAIVGGVLLIIGGVVASASVYSAGPQGAKVTWGDLEDEGGTGSGIGTPVQEGDDGD